MSSARGHAAPCRWCGQIHGALCPAVRAFEFHPDGTMKRVEFMTPVEALAAMAAPAPNGMFSQRPGDPIPPQWPPPGGTTFKEDA